MSCVMLLSPRLFPEHDNKNDFIRQINASGRLDMRVFPINSSSAEMKGETSFPENVYE